MSHHLTTTTKVQSTAETGEGTIAAPISARTSLARRALILVVMVLALGGVLTAVSAPPKAAAAGYTTASVCFTQRTGSYFNGQVAAQYYVNGSWRSVTHLTLPTGGCETVAVLPGYWVRFTVTHRGFYGYTGHQYIYNGYHHRFAGIVYW